MLSFHCNMGKIRSSAYAITFFLILCRNMAVSDAEARRTARWHSGPERARLLGRVTWMMGSGKLGPEIMDFEGSYPLLYKPPSQNEVQIRAKQLPCVLTCHVPKECFPLRRLMFSIRAGYTCRGCARNARFTFCVPRSLRESR